jgi:hypothetical protein
MGIPTLISTATASNATNVDITSGIDSTYDEYMFVFTDINPSSDDYEFTFQVNVAGASGFDETMTTTLFSADHPEDDSSTSLAYVTGNDQAQGTAYQTIAMNVGSGSDKSTAGILHLFSPSNTTFVTHFYSRFNTLGGQNLSRDDFTAGYINATAAVDEISFKMSGGNLDGVIQMYGIA